MVSQSRAVLSKEAVKTRWPSGLNCAEITVSPCCIGSPIGFSAEGIPEPCRPIHGGGHDPLAIRTELRGINPGSSCCMVSPIGFSTQERPRAAPFYPRKPHDALAFRTELRE